jgi:serine phosphatase RsbU (regulator of sigma subunit)/CHASE2 domain-containing sensor protein
MAVVAGLVILQWAGGSLVRTVDDQLYDFTSRTLAQRQEVGIPPYVLVEIDDRSIDALGRYPWGRDRFADLLARTSSGGATVVGLHVIFSEEGDSTSDASLAGALADAGNAVLASTATLAPNFVVGPPGGLAERVRAASDMLDPLETLALTAAGVGDISIVVDVDGGLRRYLPGVAHAGEVRPSFAEAMAEVSGVAAPEGLDVDGEGAFVINYSALSPAAIARISFSDVLELDQEDLTQLFEGKTVIVGPTYSGSGDHWATPLSVQTPSAYVHLYALNTLQSGAYLRTAPAWAPFFLALVLIVLLSTLVPERAPAKLVGGAVLLVSILTLGWLVAFIFGSLVIDAAFPALATVAFVTARGVEQWWHTNRDLRASNEELRESLDTLRRTRSAKERMEAELNIARDIQFSMLPLVFPPFPERTEFTLHAMLEPAREVGGDFYDFFLVDEDHLCVCIADVSGKGVPAALFMAVSKALIKARAASNLSPANVLTHVNDELAADNDSAMFVTVWLGILDLRTGGITFTNAGHNPPYVLKGGGEVVRLDQLHGPIIAAVDGLDYSEDSIRLEVGDTLLLYTDGVPEAMDPEGQLYDEDRITNRIEAAQPETVEEVVTVTADGVWEFQSTAEQADDVTIMAVKYHGATEGDA